MRLYRPTVPPGTKPLSTNDLERRLSECLAKPAFDAGPASLLLAVSGGPDSLALLHLAAELPRDRFAVRAVTVDHAAREASAGEAAHVAGICRELRVPHRTWRWDGWDGRGNFQANARRVRYDFLGAEARRHAASLVLTAHHLGDQLETVLHARDRGDGREAMAGMRALRDLAPGVKLFRPFLDLAAERLHAVLADRGLPAVADLSNEYPHYARTRNRHRLAQMSAQDRRDLERICEETARLRRRLDRDLSIVIEDMEKARGLVFAADGSVAIRIAAFRMPGEPVAQALLSRLVTAAGGALHAPARSSVARLVSNLREVEDGTIATLAGAEIGVGDGVVTIRREYGRAGPARITDLSSECEIVFDNRFDIRLSPAERDLARARDGFLAGFGATGRGGRGARTLPVLIAGDGQGDLLAVHPDLVEETGKRKLAPFENLACRVRWRALANLPVTGDEP